MSNIFLKGHAIYLRYPDIENDVVNGTWHEWFNDEEVTRFLQHGVYPNTKQIQLKLVSENLAKSDMVLLSIIDRTDHKLCGVISLQNINLLNRVAEIAVVMNGQKYPVGAPFEAMALMTQYGFERLNLNKIYAGQHVGLWKWVNTLELLGYRLEGYLKDTSIKYGKKHDSVRIGLTSEVFFELLLKRYGKYLTDDFMALMRKRRKTNMCKKLSASIQNIYNDEPLDTI